MDRLNERTYVGSLHFPLDTREPMIAYNCGHLWTFVVAERQAGARLEARGKRNSSGDGKSRTLRKMENSGNEAKKYLKTKKITFLMMQIMRVLRAN